MNRALADRLLSLLQEEYKLSFIAQQLTQNPKMTFLEVFKWFYNQYGIATEEEIIKNMAKLLNNWSPHEGMEKFIGHFDKSVTYASFAGQATASNTIVTYFLTVIKKTGKYQRAYEDWLACCTPATTTARPEHMPRISGGWSTSSYVAPTPPRFSTNLGATQHRIRVRTSVTWQIFWKIARIN